jgi:hypothetical protein
MGDKDTIINYLKAVRTRVQYSGYLVSLQNVFFFFS